MPRATSAPNLAYFVSLSLRRDPDLAQGCGLAGARDALNSKDAITIGERLAYNAPLRFIQALRLRGLSGALAGHERLIPVLALAHVFDVSLLVGDRRRCRVLR